MDILEYPRMKLVFSYKYLLGCKFSLTKFSLLINHPQKSRKLYTTKISAYTVFVVKSPTLMSTECTTSLVDSLLSQVHASASRFLEIAFICQVYMCVYLILFCLYVCILRLLKLQQLA